MNAATSGNTSLQVQQMYPQSTSNRQLTPKGSLSPLNFSSGGRSASGSMPASPTSIHSSSSAIFERDIEVAPKNVLGVSPNHHTQVAKDPHHTARAIAHEPLENAVPSVLTAAVAALGEYEGSSKDGKDAKRGMSHEEISVIAPVPQSPNTWPTSTSASTISKYGMSRSPSPHALPLPLPGAASTSSGASTPGSSPSRVGSRQPTNLAQRIAEANAAPTSSQPSPVVPGAFPVSTAAAATLPPPTLNTSLTPATDPGHAPHFTESNVASRGSTPGVIGIVPPTPNTNSFSFSAFHSDVAPVSGSPPSAAPSPLVLTPPPGTVGSRSAISQNSRTSRPTSLYEELSLSPLVVTSAMDEPLEVPADVEPIALSGHAHLHSPPSPQVVPHTLRDTSNSPSNAASKRLSFISYNDLLNSTPISSYPLSNLTSPNTEPTHQIEVSVSNGRPKLGSRGSTLNNRTSPTSEIFGSGFLGAIEGGEVPGAATAHGNSHDLGPKGGEWERGGFGTGLEERLEAALKERQTKEGSSV
ncbi:hypothetical protein FRB96_007694 [Tulasnella sp. 330]|nr:hypothetical protein FRB96_007694 [Tulasnella sp. 330]KAG8881757.1 hypothetical protein FRB97_009166 [Tulasnella sp. 331]